MLKLVVSDLDGTLIKGENKLSADVLNMIDALKQKNILFAVASGRKICELQRLFEEVKNDIIFIACDGAYAAYQGRIIIKEVINPEILEKLTFDYEGLTDKNGNAVKIIAKSYNISSKMAEYIKINRLLSLVYDDYGIKEYVKFGINKGTALKKLLKMFNIKPSDAVVFGDNLNDKEMLKLIPKSYALSDGRNEIKQICRYQTNDVCGTVRDILSRQEEVI